MVLHLKQIECYVQIVSIFKLVVKALKYNVPLLFSPFLKMCMYTYVWHNSRTVVLKLQ